MKNQISFRTIFALSVALFFLAPGCGDDKTLCELAQGEWEVTSFRFDGDEQMSTEIEEFIIEFDADEACEGDFSSVLTDSVGEQTDSGNYSIDEEEGELTVEFDGGDPQIFDLKIEGDNLEMSWSNDDGDGVIKAERK